MTGIISLVRPLVHNAMNIKMVRELATALSVFARDPGIRLIHLNADGKHFSSGADLEWMRQGLGQTEAQLKEESMELAGLFRLITEIPKVVVTAVQGKATGGAIGLIAASDLVIAEETAIFTFSEVKLGLVPATIAPYVMHKTGKGRAAGWMLSGRSFSARDARDAGIVHFLCHEGTLEEETAGLIRDLMANGPEAMKGIKNLFHQFPIHDDPLHIQQKTAELIARIRVSPEAQEGMNAFFEKRRPDWDVSQ